MKPKKNLLRCAEETLLWLVKTLAADRGWSIAVRPGKAYMTDDDGDELPLPALVVTCDKVVSNANLYDPAVGEANCTVGLIRDGRQEYKEDLDGLLMELQDWLLDPATIELVNTSPDAPHTPWLIAHEFGPPDTSTEAVMESDVDMLQLTFHCQHYIPDVPVPSIPDSPQAPD